MEHLTLEALARLVDEAPTAEESRHLSDCDECREELLAMRRQTAALADLVDPPVPPGLGARVRDAMADEARFRIRRRSWPRQISQLAAGIAIFLLGATAGGAAMRWSGSATGVRAATRPATAAAPATTSGSDGGPLTLAESESALEAAEAAYVDALTRYAELSDAATTIDPVSRLAALEGIVLTTSAALEEAPADPVINNYHLTALAQRNALMRQIDAVARTDEWF